MPKGSSSKKKHASSSKDKHASSSKDKHASSSKSKPATDPPDWRWTNEKEWDLAAVSKHKFRALMKDFDDKDFRLSRGWLCFSTGTIDTEPGERKTNHASLKFDFKPCGNHEWLGVTFGATKDGKEPVEVVDEQGYTTAKLKLNLRKWQGPPNSLEFFLELETTFDVVHGGTTLGDFIRYLSWRDLLSFGFSWEQAGEFDKVHLGCRDYVAQVLFALLDKDRIKKRPVKGGDPTISTLSETGRLTPYSFGDRDIFAALAAYYEPVKGPDNKRYTVISSSPVDEGFFLDWPEKRKRKQTGDDYPYEVYRFGTRSDKVERSQTNQGGYTSTGQGGGYGGLAGALGGPAGGYGRGPGGPGSSSGGAFMPDPSGFYPPR